jgi:hypothetical protein
MVAEALKVLERAGVLTWVYRIVSATRSRHPSPETGLKHRIKRFLYLHPWRTQTARWSVRCGI